MTTCAERLPPLIRQCEWLIKLHEADIKGRKSQIKRVKYWLAQYEYLLHKEKNPVAPANMVPVTTFGAMKFVAPPPREKWSRNMGQERRGTKP
ncbi:hypothetical protein LCGC14_0734040 [marine sediment metagenome]|uniref:Uncharacterized protein n=1 Tax=marine sediment metagenome TaxID=412755 RepID=A0A0F9QTM2_9ZZZZ